MKCDYIFWNLVVIVKDNKILLIKRNKNDFQGYVPPGGKIEFPETFFDSARREVREETNLIVDNLEFKGLSGYINEIKGEQFIYVDFYCSSFHGDLVKNGPEGLVEWVPLNRLNEIEIHPDIRVRINNILLNNNYEYQIFWDELKGKPKNKRLDITDSRNNNS
ncbi:NUDIX domain-containing protein [Enterococcus faecalis]|uniref:NUDIX domain-containing protein n=1 Tax=Enterococcus faecalis TaxID=1351 RepID=UPI000FCA36B3|nr:8-oxo-dGTP diphosphatase [Enterococcus faecalis]